MGSNFWRFASTLEKEFHVLYDRDREEIDCPECGEIIAGSEWDFVNIGGKYGYMMNQFIYTK